MMPEVGDIWCHVNGNVHCLIIKYHGLYDVWHMYDVLWLEDGRYHENFPYKPDMGLMNKVA